MQEEIWKDIPQYEGLYQVSNLGNVKSLSRDINNRYGVYISKEKLLKPYIKNNYVVFFLSKNKKHKQKSLHQLIAMAFLNHTPNGNKIVVDHINNNQLDNRIENLQIITQRENSSKDVKNKTSKYTGVSWDKNRKKWTCKIKINGKTINLGRFKCEEQANKVYQTKLKSIC